MSEKNKSVTLADIQAKIKAPKGQFNNFGKYKYRSAEDIVESVKPVINPLGYYLTLSDEMVMIGDRIYVKATAVLSNGTTTYTTTAFAREEDSKKGMDGSQVTGASSSYARKYALNGLFAIDDTKDSDATNTHDKKEEMPYTEPEHKEIKKLLTKIATIEELKKLYDEHKQEIDADVKLRKSFTERKQAIIKQIEKEASK